MNNAYHYYGMWQTKPGYVNYTDGLIILPKRIKSTDDYVAFKKRIASGLGILSDQLTLCTLTLLSQEVSELDNLATGRRDRPECRSLSQRER